MMTIPELIINVALLFAGVFMIAVGVIIFKFTNCKHKWSDPWEQTCPNHRRKCVKCGKWEIVN